MSRCLLFSETGREEVLLDGERIVIKCKPNASHSLYLSIVFLLLSMIYISQSVSILSSRHILVTEPKDFNVGLVLGGIAVLPLLLAILTMLELIYPTYILDCSSRSLLRKGMLWSSKCLDFDQIGGIDKVRLVNEGTYYLKLWVRGKRLSPRGLPIGSPRKALGDCEMRCVVAIMHRVVGMPQDEVEQGVPESVFALPEKTTLSGVLRSLYTPEDSQERLDLSKFLCRDLEGRWVVQDSGRVLEKEDIKAVSIAFIFLPSYTKRQKNFRHVYVRLFLASGDEVFVMQIRHNAIWKIDRLLALLEQELGAEVPVLWRIDGLGTSFLLDLCSYLI